MHSAGQIEYNFSIDSIYANYDRFSLDLSIIWTKNQFDKER